MTVLDEAGDLRRFRHRRQFLKFCGLDLATHQSGQFRGQTRLSKYVNDAEAICTAARQPHIPFVPKKSIEQQDMQAPHRARQRMFNHRTAVVSQI